MNRFFAVQGPKLVYYVIFALTPLALWLAREGEQIALSDYYSLLTTIGKATGIVGIGIFAGNLILSGRYQFLDRIFGGLDKVYLFHRNIGIDVFTAATIHVLSVTLRMLVESPSSSLSLLVPNLEWNLDFGRYAFYLFIVLIILTVTLARKLEYQKLKFLHSFMGVVFLLAGVHAYLIPSDTSFNMPLRWYMLGLIGIALVSFFARTVLGRLFVKRRALDVVAVNSLPNKVTEIVMEPKTGTISFIPGQFVFVRFRQAGFPYEEHPFSVTASSKEGTIRISAKALGDFTARLPELRAGASADILGPFGGFSSLASDNRRQVWVAGGIGITPFLSMARSIRDSNISDYDIDLYYSAQAEGDLVFIDELQDIASAFSNFRIHPWTTNEKGYISARTIKKETDLNGRDVFLCGPQPMMLSLSSDLAAYGVPSSQIHFELFKLL